LSAALDKVLEFVDALDASGVRLEHLDLGGGLGIRYATRVHRAADLSGTPVSAPRQAQDPTPVRAGAFPRGQHRLAADARVEYLKHGAAKNFAVVDAAMNDLVRPALYDAWHDVLPVTRRHGAALRYDVVGPVCESADFLAKERTLT